MLIRLWFRFLALALILCLYSALPLYAADAKGAQEFSFIVFGDSRLPGYSPYGRDHKDQIEAMLKKQLAYAYGPAAAAKFKYRFDPHSGELTELTVQFTKTGAWRRVEMASGWPRLIEEGIGKRSWISMRGQGQDWVYRSILAAIGQGVKKPGSGPTFCLHTGDIVYNGFQGRTIKDSPFWRDFIDRFQSKLPKGGPEGLPARFFPAPGNHESWGDEELVGFRQTMPYLKEMGFSAERRVYMFDHQGSRFIFLDTGDYVTSKPNDWGFGRPGFKGQMEYLTKWLQEAKEHGIKRVFITFHNPAFCLAGFGPLPPRHNPHRYIKPFAVSMHITVFTGHVHSTEAFLVDGVRYLVLGGAGGEQDFRIKPPPKGYPQELYWRGKPRQEDYNYLEVRVKGPKVRFLLHRWRPTAPKPYQTVELY